MNALLTAVGSQSRDGVLAAVAGTVCQRILRVRTLVLALITRIEAGTLRQVPGRTRGTTTKRELDEAARRRRAEQVHLPRRPAWLLEALDWNSRNFACQLAHLLADDEMKRHLATAPRLARPLRPLCRMLGIDLALLGETPRESKPRQRRKAAEGAATSGKRVRRRKEGAEPPEPSRAEIKRIIATRRWPSIEMQADPKRYPWYPKDDPQEDRGEDTGEDTGGKSR